MRISDWSSDVCSSDLKKSASIRGTKAKAVAAALSSASEAFIRCSISDASSTASIVSTARSSRSTYRVSSSPKTRADRKSTRLTPVTNAQLVCRLLLEKKKRINNNKRPHRHNEKII